jgi:colanic acid/amylovoran biosynthesis protein
MRIVLTGTYNSANKGDAAMQLGALRAMRERYRDITVTILSPFPDIDAPFYAPVPVARCNRRNLPAATLDLLRGFLWRLFGRRSGCNWLLSPAMRLVRDSDLVIDLSGDMLTDDHGPHVAYSHYIPILRALVLRRPYFLCAQSIGPFTITRPLARLLLQRAAEVTVRDSISRSNLAAMGLKIDRLSQTADLAFLLPAASELRANEILRTEGITPNGRPILGISISRLIERKFRARRADSAGADFIQLMKTAIERLARESDLRVLFVPHVTGPVPDKDDRIISAMVNDGLDPMIHSAVLNGDYRPEELKAVIARCSVFCGARMHANIAALSSGVPTVAISYSHKTPGIMAEFGMTDFVVPIDSITEISLGDALLAAFRNRAEISTQLSRRIVEIQAKASENLAGLRQLTEQPTAT